MLIQSFDSPIDFTSFFVANNYSFSFEDIREICQGGPLVGKFYINGKKISDNEFGGPFLLEDEYVYIPMYTRFSFTLIEIDLSNNYIYKKLGDSQNLIWLKEKKENCIFYYKSIDKSNLASFRF